MTTHDRARLSPHERASASIEALRLNTIRIRDHKSPRDSLASRRQSSTNSLRAISEIHGKGSAPSTKSDRSRCSV